jgi:hypothetical protein
MPMTIAYARALYNALLHPHVRVSKWCHHPTQCKLRHRLVLIRPPQKPARFGFKHIEV